jgi:hypothetical protein
MGVQQAILKYYDIWYLLFEEIAKKYFIELVKINHNI